jgi:hypothetical protein
MREKKAARGAASFFCFAYRCKISNEDAAGADG